MTTFSRELCKKACIATAYMVQSYSPGGAICSPLCNTCFLGPIQVHNPNSISTRSAIFVLYRSRQSAIGHDRHLFPLKNCPSHGAFTPQNCPLPCEIWTPSNASFLEPTRAHNSNGISIGSAVFAELRTATDPTDRQTDRPRYSDGNNMPHLRM